MYERHATAIVRVEDTAAWLEARYDAIGASEAPVLVDEGFISQYRLWREKRRELTPKDLSDNEAVQWGIRFEARIAEVWSEVTGFNVKYCGTTFQSKQHPFARATPDFTLGETAIPVQVKNVNMFAKYPKAETRDGYTKPEGWPERVRTQCMWEMAVTGADAEIAVALVGGQRMVWTRFAKDPEYEAELLKLGAAFWSKVKSGDPPTMHGGDDERDAIEDFWGPDRETEAAERLPELGEDADEWARMEVLLSKEEKGAEKRRGAFLNSIREVMGPRKKARAGGYVYYFQGGDKPRVTYTPRQPVEEDVEEGDEVLCVAKVTPVQPSLRRSGKGE